MCLRTSPLPRHHDDKALGTYRRADLIGLLLRGLVEDALTEVVALAKAADRAGPTYLKAVPRQGK